MYLLDYISNVFERSNTKRPHQGIDLLTPLQMYDKLLSSNSFT